LGASLKIAFDAKRLFHNREGLGAYARTVVADLQAAYPQHKYYLCTPVVSEHDFVQPFLDPSKFTVIQPSSRQLGSLWRTKTVVKDLERVGIDLYFGLSNELPFGIARSSVAAVVMIHDVLYREFPQQFSRVDRWIYNKKFKHALRAADLILSTSAHTKADITKHFDVRSKTIEVLYQPIAPSYRSVVHETLMPSHYLYVGTINARKNLELIIQAYKLLPEAQRRKVVIVGEGGRYKNQMLDLIKLYGLVEWFDFKGNVSEYDLISLYKAAIALIFPSKYEGFGRPIVEALSMRVPVITGSNSSLPEVVGKYGIIIEYDRPESLVEAISKMNRLSDRESFLEGVEAHLEKFDSSMHSHSLMSLLASLQKHK